nr:hypothetical protein [Actinomyces sp.]
MTSPVQPLSAPSPADLPTTAMSPEEAEAAAEKSAQATEVLPGPAPTEALPTAAATEQHPQAGWSAPAAADDLAPTDPLEAIRSTRPWPGARSAEEAEAHSAPGAEQARSLGADPHDSEAVWSGSSLARGPEAEEPARRSGPRPGTLVWGLVLVTIGVVLAATGLGVRIDPVSAAIILLAGAGAALLIIALLPRRRPAR